MRAGARHGADASPPASTNICYYYTGGVHGAMPWFSTMANGYYVLMDYDGRPKPTMMAYSALEQQLDGATPRGMRRAEWPDRAPLLERPGAIAVVWSEQERTLASKARACSI